MSTGIVGKAAPAADDAQGTDWARGRHPRWRRAGRLAAAAIAVVALSGLYWLQARSAGVSSDGASNVLQGADMLHGNLLLHGWVTSDVSFYATELVQYMLLQTVLPMGPGVVYAAAAMTYTLLVVLTALLAKGRAGAGRPGGREGILRAGLGAGIMVAPALGPATGTLLHGPDHTGSAVPVLLAWLVIDRCPPRWYVPAVVCLLLAWGAASDPLIDITGAAALAAACTARSGRRLIRRRGLRHGDPAGRNPAVSDPAGAPAWFEPSLAVAAVASVGLAALATTAIRAAGGFTVRPVNTTFTGIPGLWRHAAVTGKGLLRIFGAAFWPGHAPAWQLVFACAHLAGVALALAGLILALRHFFRPDSLLTAGLAAGVIITIAALMTSAYAIDLLSIREAVAVLPFSAVLAGRLIPRYLAGRPRLRALRPVPALAAAGVLYAGMLAVNAFAARPAAPQYQDVAGWLSGHHLTSGLASSYWLSNVITVDTGNRVRVRDAVAGNGAVRRPGGWEDDIRWYDPAAGTANFLLTDAGPGTGEWKDQLRAAERTFGPPARTYRVGDCTVFTWTGNILPRLRA